MELERGDVSCVGSTPNDVCVNRPSTLRNASLLVTPTLAVAASLTVATSGSAPAPWPEESPARVSVCVVATAARVVVE